MNSLLTQRWIRSTQMLVAAISLGFAGAATAAPVVDGGKLGISRLQLGSAYELDSGASKNQPDARALTLASADVDADGFPDLFSGYATEKGGVLTVNRGNREAWAPSLARSHALIRTGQFPPGFLADAQTLSLPVAPELMVSGDFDQDGIADLVIAERGDDAVYLLRGTAAGLGAAQKLSQPGAVDALAAGNIDHPDGFADLAIAVSSKSGPSLQIYTHGVDGKLRTQALPAAATELHVGQVDSSPMGDVIALADGKVLVLHGVDRTTTSNTLETLDFGFAVQTLALGNFIWDRVGATELALLKDDGTVQIATRGVLQTTPFTLDEIRAKRRAQIAMTHVAVKSWQPGIDAGWRIAESIPAQMSKAAAGATPRLLAARLSNQPADDLLAVDMLGRAIKVIAMDGQQRKSVQLPTNSAPIAVLSLQTSAFVRPSLVVLGTGKTAVTVLPSAPASTFTVTKATDTNDGVCNADCSLREAISAANAAAGADTIFLPAGTYQLTIANAVADENGNASGDLDVNDDTTITGASATTTIIQAGTNTSNGIDKVFAFNPDCSGPVNSSISGVTVRYGRNTQPSGSGFFSETGGGIDVCNTGAGGFTMTNVIVDQNTNVNSYAGGVNFDSVQPANGNYSITNSTISGNRTTSTASVLKNGGGLNLYGDSHSVNITSTTVNSNTSAAEGGGIFVRHTFGGAIQFSGGSISNNTAASSGGGVSNKNAGASAFSVLNKSVISGNVSQGTVAGFESRGGGIFVLADTTTTTTIREAIITGNQASTGSFQGGGGIAAALGTISARFNRIVGNIAGTGAGSGFHNANATVTATSNWWGCNAGPGSAPCDRSNSISGTLITAPQLILRHSAAPSAIVIGQSSTLTADFLRDSAAGVIVVADLDALIGTNIVFNNPVRGTLSAAQTTLQANGTATATFTGTSVGAGSVDAVVDAQTSTAAITISLVSTTTTITADTPDPSPVNTAVTVNYSVAVVAPGSGTPTGNVTVSDGVNNCVGTVAAGTCNITLTTAGARTLTATYAGDGSFAGSTSAGAAHTVTNLTANLGITKTDGVVTATPGGSTTYTITTSNAGPDPAPATVADTFPASLTCTWTCVGAGGGTCTAAGTGNINDSVNLPVGGSVSHTASCAISASATGTLSNTATVTAAVTDPTPGNNSATDSDTLTPSADVSIAKTDGFASATPGGSTTYTIVASNSGPSTATGVTVNDTFPASLTCNSTSVAAGGASGNDTPIGGNINDSGITLPPGASVTYTAVCAISAAATGSLSNTATVSSATTDPAPGNNSATDTDTLVPSADLAVTKTDGVTTAIPGGSTTYTIMASNAGPSNVSSATVADTFPAPLTCNWTCVGAGGGTCTAAGSGNISQSVNLPSGGSVSFTASCTISASASGAMSNTATVSSAASDSNPSNNFATDVDTLVPNADLSITKTDGSTTAIPGSSTTYTITASNSGPSNVAGATVADTFPATLTCTWTCVGAGGGTCTAAGAGNINQPVTLPAGGSTAFTAVCAISGSASGTLSNTATVAVPGGVTDPTPGNNSATDSDNLVAGAATQLAFGQQPVNTAGGATIAPSPTVRILDQFGNLTTSTASVTIAIGNNPAGGTLSGTTTVAAVAGVATFGNLSINTAGTGYTLAASSAGLTGISSNAFNITVGAAAQLAFGQQPVNSLANVVIAPAPTVRILDAGGNLTASTANVTVAIGSNPGAGTLAGTLIVAATAGVASFSNLVINNPGNGYTLTAASTGLTGATSNTFNIACAATVVTNNNDSGAGSLRQTIADACTGGTITFEPIYFGVPRTITLTSGELVPARDMNIVGPGANLLTISGNNASRVVLSTGINLGMSSMTLSGGNRPGGAGGAIAQTSGTLTLTDVVLTGNTSAVTGGAMAVIGGTANLLRVQVINNSAGNASGVFVQDGTLTAFDSTFSGNSGFDGAVLRISNSGGPTASVLTLTNVTISGNNTTTGSSAVRSLANTGGLVTLAFTNVTISGNTTSGSGNGALWFGGSGQHNVSMRNTIMAGNTVNGAAFDIEGPGTFDAGSRNNVIGTGGPLIDGVNGNQVGVNNPVLAPLSNYGGTTPTRALLPGSPAINAGNNTGAPATDQRGIARVGVVDIGAYESRGFTLTLAGGDNQAAGPGLAFAAPLSVSVAPIVPGEPVDGGVVTFTPPGAGVSASLAPNPATIAGGSASTTATANATIGSYTVSASANGASAPVNFTLTNAGSDLSINDVTVTEGDAATSNATFTVTRSNSLTAFSVPYSITASSAQAVSDYTATSGTLTFAVGGALTQTINVPVVGDLIVEATETATLNLGTVTNSTGVTTITDGSGLLTISDNDSAVLAFNPVSVSQTEATSPMAFTVTLSNPVQSGVTLTLNSAFGTATAADFTPIVGGTVSFAANSKVSQTVNVVINNDALDENDETFTLNLSGLTAVGNVTSGALSATGTILDDDLPPVISISSPSQPEGNAGTTPMNFTVSLSAVSGRDVTFTRATADGSATVADNDYLALAAAPMSIPAGSSSLIVPVQIVGDTTYEGNETFSLNLSNIANAIVAAGPVIEGSLPSLSGIGTIEEDDQQPTTTTITADTPDPSVVGQPYLVTVTVTAQMTSPLGTLTISDGIASCGPVALTTGTAPNSSASCSLTSTTAGNKTLTASYTAASSAFANSNGTTAHQVNSAATAISVSGPPRSRINQLTSFSFALSVTAPGAGTPTGTVTLSSGASTCTATLPASSCNLSFSPLGSGTVSASYAGTANYSASTSSGAGNAQTLVYALADLEVSKSDGVDTYKPGDLIVYTVQMRNLGPDTAANLRLRDMLPAGLANVLWSCDSSGGATCAQNSGGGDLDAAISSYPVGALLNYTFYGNVQGSPPELVNTAFVELPADTTIDDPDTGNNSAVDIDLLDMLFANGFEDVAIRSASGSYRLPSLTLRGVLDAVARTVYRLDDAQGEALRVYARVWQGEVQYALAKRDSSGALRLAAWHSYSGEPVLSWSAHSVSDGWVLDGVQLR